jgi:hypothetical protein
MNFVMQPKMVSVPKQILYLVAKIVKTIANKHNETMKIVKTIASMLFVGDLCMPLVPYRV